MLPIQNSLQELLIELLSILVGAIVLIASRIPINAFNAFQAISCLQYRKTDTTAASTLLSLKDSGYAFLGISIP